MSDNDVLAAFEMLLEAMNGEKARLADALREATLNAQFAEAQRLLPKTKRTVTHDAPLPPAAKCDMMRGEVLSMIAERLIDEQRWSRKRRGGGDSRCRR